MVGECQFCYSGISRCFYFSKLERNSVEHIPPPGLLMLQDEYC